MKQPSFDQYLFNHRRLARVMDYLDSHLDDDIKLDTLADVACLSRFHFQRIYTLKVKETPMATVRRLRLQHAFDGLRRGEAGSITDLAVQTGYGSVAAFSRAFSRAFGKPPTEVLSDSQVSLSLPSRLSNATSDDAQLAIVDLPAVPIIRHSFTGKAKEVFDACDGFGWTVSRMQLTSWRHCSVHPDGWTDPAKYPDARVRMWHCALSSDFPSRIADVERGFLPPGHYARFTFVGRPSIDVPRLMARVEAETSWQ
ncbi:MAG TPA: AraC family transcriptional regulator, partial [Rhodocyclaceae bacterium]|nr:AraC family transcriptional regulator [Rhodocyclaceae bacterium]